jgi:hypothetical protein
MGRLRQAIDRSAAEQHRSRHQILFYSLLRDLNDLVVNRSTMRKMVSAKEILELQAEYATAEHEAMRAATQETLNACQLLTNTAAP